MERVWISNMDEIFQLRAVLSLYTREQLRELCRHYEIRRGKNKENTIDSLIQNRKKLKLKFTIKMELECTGDNLTTISDSCHLRSMANCKSCSDEGCTLRLTPSD